MTNFLVHEIELYPFETFESLLNHEVRKSRRYGTPLTFIHLAVETDTSGPDAQHGAEVFAINALNVHLRDTDIPCRRGNEFLVFMPSTDEKGGRIVCERLEKLFYREAQVYDKVSFKLSAYIGLASNPGDRSLTSKKIMDEASQALQHARENRVTNTVVFSDIK
jgi:diguanylate cyclase (GGDEF)-like protein